MGFNIWKGKSKYYNGTKTIKQHEFLCSKVFKLDDDLWRKIFKELDTRTGCKVFVCFTAENGV